MIKKIPYILSSRFFLYIFIFVLYYVIDKYFKQNPMNIIDNIFSFFTFLLKNIVSIVVLFLASKKEIDKEKYILYAVSILCLLFSYYFNITNNIALFLFYFSLHYESKIKKIIMNFIAFLFFAYPFIMPIYYRYVYGTPDDKIIKIDNIPNIINTNNEEIEIFSTKKHSIEINKVASIELNAKAVYIEHYDSPFHYDYYQNELYDDIAPLDLSIFIGKMAKNWKDYDVKHEQRLLIIKGNIIQNEWNNIHIIPANETIHKGFKTISRGDDVYLKGYLIDWNGINEYNYFQVKTARSFNSESIEKAGGRFTFLCSQFFVEELSANGFTFK